MVNRFFFSEPAAPVERLERRVKMQQSALDQARRDLAAARLREGLPSIEEPLEGERDELAAAPSVYISAEHRRIAIADERRRRGLGAEPGPGVLPTVPATAQLIIAADRKARGLAPLSEVDPDPNFMPATGLALRRRHDPDTGNVEVYFAPAQAPQTTSPKTTAELIIASHRKANGERK